MNHDIFISYSSKNSTAAQAVCHELEDNGIKCWMAPRDIPVGSKYASVITKAIVDCRMVVLVFSDDSARSPWVESEINIAFSNRKIIVPYKIDKTKIEDYDEFYLMLNNRHWIEAYPDYKTRFKELVAIVAQTLGKELPVNKPVAPTYAMENKEELHIKPKQATLRKLKVNKSIWITALCVLLVVLLGCGVFDIIQNKRLLSLSDDEFVAFEIDGKYGFKLKSTGKEVIPLKYDGAWPFSEGLAKVKLNDKYGFVDKTSKEIIPLKYDGAWSFREGLAPIELNDKWGYIDKTGKEIIPFKYDSAKSFSEGLAMVKLNDKYGFVDKTSKEIIPLKYDDAWSFSEGLAPIELNDKWGYIDKTGKEVIPLKYDYANGFNEGLADVELNDVRFIIDKNGNRIK